MYAKSFDIQLLVFTMQGATSKVEEEACSGKEIHGVGKMEIVSKIMYIGLGGHIAGNAHQ